jgi:uncharacterized membrane-anchored protein YitT (DUF2179 family)
MKKTLKRFILINIGIAIMAAGLYLFLIPANLAVGGVTGLAMVIQSYVPSVNLGLLMGAFNIVLFILAFAVIGKEFGGYTIYTSFMLSGMIGFFEYCLPNYTGLAEDLLINLIFGILIQGSGMAIIFYENASTGGTDIIAKIINIFSGIGIGKALFLSDALITLAAGFAFGPLLGLYAFLGILINGLVIDKVIAGFDTKIQAMIISDYHTEISKYVHEDLERGTTYLNGLGGYSLDDKKILSVILNRKEYMKLKHQIRKIDPMAFISVTFVHEVFGEGFNLQLQKTS